MDKFESILANIQQELAELQEINRSLCEENASLREKLRMPIPNNNDELSLEVVFENFNLPDDKNGSKLKTYSSLKRSNYNTLEDFRNKNVCDLIKINQFGPTNCAILIVLLEHYDIPIQHPKVECITSATTRNEITKISKELLPSYRERIVFTK